MMLLIVLAMCPTAILAQKAYGPGVSDTEIKLGQTMPYSGPASGLSVEGKTDIAYFNKINEEGGINGRMVKLISLDDGYSPPKTVEQIRRLIEDEQVLALFKTLGTASNSAVYKYVNARKVPHLFILSGAEKFRDPDGAPWTVPLIPAFTAEGKVFAKYIQSNRPNARVAVLYQNDDLGKDLLRGLRQGFGAEAETMIVAQASFEMTDPTVDSQIITLNGSRADTLIVFAVPRFVAQALKRTAAIGWKPQRFIASPSANVEQVMKPVGLDISTGVLSVKWLKDPSDPTWKDDPGMRSYLAFMQRYNPQADPKDWLNANAYTGDQLMVEVLRRCGEDLTRENVMRQALSLKEFELPMLLPGIRVTTSPEHHTPISQFQLVRFDGTRWVALGSITGDDIARK
jgi:ABC-type branched-subunit amino acid transport system substrate-binding protein